jgi:hypothetical protein
VDVIAIFGQVWGVYLRCADFGINPNGVFNIKPCDAFCQLIRLKSPQHLTATNPRLSDTERFPVNLKEINPIFDSTAADLRIS